MKPTELQVLRETLSAACADLPKVTQKRMYGCPALCADGTVFALVWKQGRIGLKLPEPAHLNALMAVPGADPWVIKKGRKQMTVGSWVLLPPGFRPLSRWAAMAHAHALREPNGSAKPSTPARPIPFKRQRKSGSSKSC